MKEKSASNREGRFTSRRDYEDYLDRVFRSTVSQYVEVIQLPAICAIQIDRESPSRSRRWTPQDAHYKCDVEHATEIALRDRIDLQQAWFRLVAEDATVHQKETEEVISRCGRLYAARGLSPWTYYRENRYPRRKAVVTR